MAIPRILHRIWVGTEPMPDDFAAFGEEWSRMHPDWEHHLWTEENLPADLERREILDTSRIPAERADLLRYELLWRFGGVYVDADMEPLKPLDPLLEGRDFFIGDLKPGRVNNAVIGAAKGHPIAEGAMREAKVMTYTDAKDAPVEEIKVSTGPRFLDTVVERFPAVTRLAPETFYPEEGRLDGAYTYHHAARTWVSSDPVERERLKLERELGKYERRLARANAQIAVLEAEKRELQGLVDALGSNRWLFGALRVVGQRLVRVARALLRGR